MNKKYLYCLLLITLVSEIMLPKRSIHRPTDPCIPRIDVFFSDDPHSVRSYENYSLRSWSIFGRYNASLLNANRLPNEVPYRYNPQKTVPSELLSTLIEQFITELLIAKKGQKFKDFIVVKDKDFNYQLHTGLVIAKFKNYPFFLKLFHETPQGFTRPYSQSFESGIMSGMCGAHKRFCSGFTRIPNLHRLQKKISESCFWHDKITLPQKWYWTPSAPRYFTVKGFNMNTAEAQSIEYPCTYAIICEEVTIEQRLHALRKHERRLVRDITQFLGNDIDPHIKNFFIEKETGKIAIIDTEHFPSMIGLEEPIVFKGNLNWYAHLCNYALRVTLWQTKKERRENAQRPAGQLLNLDINYECCIDTHFCSNACISWANSASVAIR